MQSWLGFAVHVSIVGSFTATGFFASSLGGIQISMPWFAPLGAFAYAFLVIMFPLRIAVKQDPDGDWSKPSWFSNPFNGLVRRSNLSGWGFAGLGLAAFMRTALFGHPIVIPLFFFAFGLGTLAGIEIFYARFMPKLLVKNSCEPLRPKKRFKW
jgi:hypothetical protein